MNSSSEVKHVSVTYIPPPPPMTGCQSSSTGRPNKQPGDCPGKVPMSQGTCFNIPEIQICKPSKCPIPPVSKPPNFGQMTCPQISCPPIQRPPVCCPQITIQHELPAGSCTTCETMERESNTVSLTANGKTIILCSEGFERSSKYVTRKDTKGMTHTYCKESETKSNTAKSDREYKPCVSKKPNPCQAKGSIRGKERSGESLSESEDEKK